MSDDINIWLGQKTLGQLISKPYHVPKKRDISTTIETSLEVST